MYIAKKIPGLVNLTNLNVFRRLLGFENLVKWACERKLRSGESNDSRTVFIGQREGNIRFPNLTTPLLGLNPYCVPLKYQKFIFHLHPVKAFPL